VTVEAAIVLDNLVKTKDCSEVKTANLKKRNKELTNASETPPPK
jgi:hypothetical protein